MADTHNEAEVKTRYPVTSGLEANEKHEGRQINLVPTGKLGIKTIVRSNERKGFE